MASVIEVAAGSVEARDSASVSARDVDVVVDVVVGAWVRV